MNEICGDNRFEIIAKAKEHLLDATNIDTSEDEMKVIDDFLFRCWQMGWLDRYDRKTEPKTCEECKHWNDTEDGCADRHGCRATTEDWQDWKDKMWSEAVVTEPTTEDCSTVPTSSILEQVDEPQYEMGMGTLKCDNCSEYGSFKCTKCDGEMYFKRLEPKDEPQTERSSE